MVISMGRLILLGVVIALIGVLSCDYQEGGSGPKYSSAAEQLMAEYDKGEADQTIINQVLAVSKELVLESRGAGVTDFVTQLKATLALRGIDGKVLDGILDSTLGDPLPGVEDMMQSIPDTGSVKQPLKTNNPNRLNFECPPLGLVGQESCVQLVDAVLAQTKKKRPTKTFYDWAEQKSDQAADLQQQPQEFQDYAKQYLGHLSATVYQYGVDAAAIRAEYTLRHAGVCDDQQVDGEEIARLRGIDDAEKILRQLIGRSDFQLAPQGGECLRIGPAGAQTQARINAAIDKYVKENRLCPDTNVANTSVKEAERIRRQGIDRGIKSLTTTIWVGVVRKGIPKNMTQYTVVNIDGCEPKDQIRYTTSPLVVDLDGDGLELSTDRVRFDLRATGQPQQVTWPGKREGLLAIDLNDDGRITSGRELFGNRSDCGDVKCADGAVALATHDSNLDGVINSRDSVFDSLRIWVDENHDGRSQAGEIGSLADHGIKSLSLKASYFDRRVPAGKISLSLTVKTDKGERTAYDVWFNNLASPGFSTPLQ